MSKQAAERREAEKLPTPSIAAIDDGAGVPPTHCSLSAQEDAPGEISTGDHAPDDETASDAAEPSPPLPSPSPKGKKITVVDRRFWAQQRDEDDSAEKRPRKPSYVRELEDKIAHQSEQISGIRAQHREALAEFENAKARLRRDIQKEIEGGKRRILAELLEVIDNLERAFDAGQTGDDYANLLKGVGMVRDQFLAKLADLGVRKMASLGQPFDPQRHDAISQMPAADAAQDGKVVGVVKECYLIGDETLRPGQVAVGKAPQ